MEENTTPKAKIHIISDVDCEVYMYGKHLCSLKAGEGQEVPMLKGNKKITAVSKENPEDKVELTYMVTSTDIEDFIEIKLERVRRTKEKVLSRKKYTKKALKIFLIAIVPLLILIYLSIINNSSNYTTNQSYGSQDYVENVKNLNMKMVYVEGGTFTMGATEEQSGEAYGDEFPTHRVTLDSYYIGACEVTQAQWRAVMGSNPSYFTGDNNPVEKVSWNDAMDFCRELSNLTGRTYTLPTEAQWEYAARGGNKSRKNKYSGSFAIDAVAWYTSNSGSKTHPVGQKRANELGIYDMSGNVWEWCSDWYGSYSSSPQTNPTGPLSGEYRVLRGGSWDDNASYCRVSLRGSGTPSNVFYFNGFRVVCIP